MQSYQQAQYDFRAALCDSFNTPEALSVLTQLIAQANLYLAARPRPKNIKPLRSVGEWITRMLRMLGLGEGPAVNEEGAIGWGEISVDGAVAVDVGATVQMWGPKLMWSSHQREEVLMPYLRALSAFRDDIRKLALGNASPKEILELCDRLRDNELVDLGVALDDQEGKCRPPGSLSLNCLTRLHADGKALVKLAPSEELKKARAEKLALIEAKAARKAAAAAAEEARLAAKLEKAKLSPTDMFRPPHVEAGAYSAWDAEGLPTQDGEGVELPKSRAKKLKKDWDAQKKLHEEWKAGKV